MSDGYYRTEVEANQKALETALEALRRIKDNDPGPARYIAEYALRDITYFDATSTFRNGDGSERL